jgi:hypothetical protein
MNHFFGKSVGMVAALFALCMSHSEMSLSQTARSELKAAPRLMVKVAASNPKAAERILEGLNKPDSAEHSVLQMQTSFPTRARFLVGSRLPAERRVSASPNDPAEQLHRWLVLEYATVGAAEAARKRMEGDQGLFERVRLDSYENGFSVLPTDPNYDWSTIININTVSGTSSHAAHSLLGLPVAWDRVQGTAYVADIDTGIQVIHEDLVSNLRNHFSASVSSSPTIEEAPLSQKRGHGTHTAGIIAASPNNGAGTSGVCWSCSLMVIRITDDNAAFTCSTAVAGIYEAIRSGAQVLNMSLFLNNVCAGAEGPVEDAINLAAARQVSFSAAAGNEVPSTLYPATNPYVMSVGATNGGGAWASWSAPGKIDFAAPGERIYSTFYSMSSWSTAAVGGVSGNECHADGNESDYAYHNYGWCTGTSMSSPMIAGAAALIRSANPLLSDWQVKSYLAAYANRYGAPSSAVGAGVPDVGLSVQSVLYGAGGNLGLTPLFVLHAESPVNRFYTTVPQMASAAINFGLKHGSIALRGNFGYVPAPDPAEASPVSGYSFPGAAGTPVAAVNLLTTVNRYGQATVPLNRFSYGDSGLQGIHAYDTTPPFGFASGFVRDGIEGYMYPVSSPQPPGTVRLMRRYNSATNRYALFPESQLAYFENLGYMTTIANTDMLGYVCPHPLPNVGVCPGAADYAMPAVTSASSSTFSVGIAKTFTITASGTPAPSISLSGTLPTGLTFTPGSGSATISGTAAAGTVGTYPLTITASNIVGTVTQNFTLSVAPSPTIAVYSGSSQSANQNTAFASPLVARVLDASGNPLSGINVTFNSPVSGASATLNGITSYSASATTDASGIASVNATANATVGSYTVIAGAPAVAGTANFSLTNTAAPTCTPGPYGAEYPAPADYDYSGDVRMGEGGVVVFSFTPTTQRTSFSEQLDIYYDPWPQRMVWSISQCKGDFNVAGPCNPGTMYSYAQLDGYLSGNPASYCIVQPNTTYYLNIKFTTCSSGLCGLRVYRRNY